MNMAPSFVFLSIWSVFVSLLTVSVCERSVPFDFKFVEILTPETLLALQQTPHVSLVYYYKRDLPRLRAFFKELDKSAEYLAIYGSKTGIIDCNEYEGLVEGCKMSRVEHNVYSFRDGSGLLTLELETMFDVNSIMSNILQLILLHEVPIIQTRSDRQQLEVKNKGKSDVIFSFHKAIGTYEHRVFMEVAYAYQDRYQFGITTETKTAEGLDDLENLPESADAAIWVLYCKDANLNTPGCPSVRYRGKMDLASLASFLKALSLPRVFEMPAHGLIPTCRKEKVNCVFLYHTAATKHQVQEAAEALKHKITGVAGLVIVDTEAVDAKEIQDFDSAPALGVLMKDKDLLTMMDDEWTLSNIEEFLQRVLFNEEPADLDTDTPAVGNDDNPKSSTDPKDLEKAGYNLPTVEEVETQDDQVAEAVFQLNRVPMKLNLVPALTDKTFPDAVHEQPLVSVLFYLPFDSRSMAFLRAYGEASFSVEDQETSRSPLVRVNCFDWTDVCGQQNVSEYPTVRIYKQGREPFEYKGALDTDAVVSTIKLLQQEAPLALKTQEEAQMFVGGKLPENVTLYSNMSVLGLFVKDRKGEGLPAFMEAAKTLQNMTVFGYMVGDMAKTIAAQLGQDAPCVIVFHHDDPYSESKSLTGADLTTEKIIDLVKRSQISTLPELTMEIFPLMYQENKPILILFCDKYEISETVSIKQTIADITPSFPGVLFSWMHARAGSVGAAIFSEYTWSSNLPSLSVVYHRTGMVYNKVEGEFTGEAITEWLTRVVNGQEEPSKMLPKGDWNPAGRGYDFLALSEIESRYGENALHNQPTENIIAAEEYGAGFNNEGVEIDYNKNGQPSRESDDTESSVDDEIRSELLELSKSRLYHHVPDRKAHEDKKEPMTETEVKSHHKQETVMETEKETSDKDKSKSSGKMDTQSSSKHSHTEL